MKRPCACGLAVLVGLAAGSSALAQSRGPDVIVGTLYTPTRWSGTGAVAGYQAYSVGTYSCNRGDKLLSWIASTPAHPVIGQNIFRYSSTPNGGSRFEHISQSWLKHGFTALQGGECSGDNSGIYAPPNSFPYAIYTANPAGGVALGWGASDPYSSSLNGGISSAGPKSNVNATTGVFAYPIDWSAFPGGVAPAANTGTGSPDRRLKVDEADLNTTTFPGARFFYEGQYVTADDSANGNRNNSVSWVECALTTTSTSVSNATTREQAGIQAWQTIDAAVKCVPIDVPGDGRFWLAWRVTSNGGSPATWDYEYALQNLNSDRSGASFTVPTSASAISNIDAHYVLYHSGEIWSNTPWNAVNTGAAVVWSSPATYAVDQKTNALRWGTLYNFRFRSTSAPAAGSVALGLFKPGAGAFASMNSISIAADVPGGANVAGTPVNDTCAGAVAMYGTKIGFSTVGATSAGPNECSAAIDKDIWFSYTVPGGCSGTLTVDTTGSSFASRVAVYAACPGGSPSAVACSASSQSVSFSPSAGATYLIRVGGSGGASGNGVLSVTPGCPAGACCNSSGNCQIVTATACADMCAAGVLASYGGDNSTCGAANANCATFAGACCNASTGACSSGSSGSCCNSGGVYQGNGSSCSPSPCPGAGRCCNTSTGACTVVISSACTGTFTSGGTCATACPGTGSCCNNSTGVCSMVFSAGCGSGSTFLNTSTCSPSPCPTGACCVNATGACSSTIQSACGSGSTWFAAACTPSPCPQPPAPANDACANAIALYDNIAYTGSNTTATTDYTSGSQMNCGSGNASNLDVWFKYTPATSGNVRVTTSNLVSGDATNFDTVVSVHSACTGGTVLACNDDNGIGGTPSLSSNIAAVNLTAGTTYLIRVAGYTGSSTATGAYTVRVIGGGAVPPTPPANDNCADRQGVGVGAPIAFDTTNATTDGPAVAGCAFSGQVDKDIWFNYPAQTTGNLTISLCGSSYDTRVAVYETSLCTNINNATLVACNDNFACGTGNGLQSQLVVPVVLGTSYTIRIGGNSVGGAGTMLLTVVTTVGACCDFQGQCHSLTSSDCSNAGGAFNGAGSSCSPNPCPQPGACCVNTTCSYGLPAACTGVFQGAGVVCGPVGNPTTCCIANFNQVNGLSVQDVFDYLAAWFSGDPRADINGGGLAVADIFAFLNLWFAGC